MRWTIVAHPEAGIGVIAETALPSHEARGWARQGEWSEDPEALRAVLKSEPGITPEADPPATQEPDAEQAPAVDATPADAAAPAARRRTKER